MSQPRPHKLGVGDVPGVVNLHRLAFAQDALRRTIYSCPGINLYLVDQLSGQSCNREHTIIGVFSDKEVVAYGHYRRLASSWHLNHIAVHPQMRGRGLARAIWAFGARTGQRMGFGTISLDVSADNELAQQWYERRGLRVVRTTWTYELDLVSETATEDCEGQPTILNWAEVEAMHARYGFSQLRISIGEQVLSIGRLGSCYYQTSDQLPSLVALALRDLDPIRKLLLHSPAQLPLEEPRLVGVSHRMEGGL